MPYVQIRIAVPELHPDTEQLVAAQATTLMAETMGKRAELTVVEIVRCQPAHWFVGGQRIATAAAYADIKITQGTNTAPQKTALLAAFHEMLGRALGEMAVPNYVVIHEIAATDWGYDGRPQAARRRGAL